MRLLKTLFMAALFSFGASYAQACAVDSVSAKTDTTISISWDVSACKRLSASATFRVCWKNAANSGNACIPPTLDGYGETGTTTITGLSPSTPYRIRTLWHQRSNWWDVTTRVVTTNPSPTSSGTVLRYEKGTGQRYCVRFYWKNPPPLPPNREWVLALGVETKQPIGWSGLSTEDVANVSFNSSTSEYAWNWPNCKFSNNRKYQAALYKRYIADSKVELISNGVEWK